MVVIGAGGGRGGDDSSDIGVGQRDEVVAGDGRKEKLGSSAEKGISQLYMQM